MCLYTIMGSKKQKKIDVLNFAWKTCFDFLYNRMLEKSCVHFVVQLSASKAFSDKVDGIFYQP